MKIIVTGSLGNISQPLAEILITRGHSVTVVSDAVAEELLLSPKEKTIRYVGSEEMTCNEAAKIIGSAVGKPWLKWMLLPDKEMLQGLKMAKVQDKLAETLVEMQAAMQSGKSLVNFHRNQPKMGKIKLADFAKEFAAAYHKTQRTLLYYEQSPAFPFSYHHRISPGRGPA